MNKPMYNGFTIKDVGEGDTKREKIKPTCPYQLFVWVFSKADEEIGRESSREIVYITVVPV